LFAFEWEDPHTGKKTQMTWTRIPQGFTNSPTLFREALAADLSTFLEESKLHFASIHGRSAPGKPQPREVL
jgi:hypothetical protein